MHSDIRKYNAAQKTPNKQICIQLATLIDKDMSKAESKIWHRHPVWFIDGNPIVGYAVRKENVQLLFWSGQSFKTPGLDDEGSFKAAQMRYKDVKDIKVTLLRKWLKESKKIQWDYKNIVKRKGQLVKIGTW